jgi:hypothetical protein
MLSLLLLLFYRRIPEAPASQRQRTMIQQLNIILGDTVPPTSYLLCLPRPDQLVPTANRLAALLLFQLLVCADTFSQNLVRRTCPLLASLHNITLNNLFWLGLDTSNLLAPDVAVDSLYGRPLLSFRGMFPVRPPPPPTCRHPDSAHKKKPAAAFSHLTQAEVKLVSTRPNTLLRKSTILKAVTTENHFPSRWQTTFLRRRSIIFYQSVCLRDPITCVPTYSVVIGIRSRPLTMY